MQAFKILVVLIFLVNSTFLQAGGSINKSEMLDKLHFAEIKTRLRDKAIISPKDSKMLPGKPVSIFSMYVDLKHTGNIRVTVIEFNNEQLAIILDKRSINGFQAKNWFFIGMVDTKSAQEIKKAIER